MGRKAKVLTGEVFGRLTAIDRIDDYVSPSGRKMPVWRCECSCGNEVNVMSCHLMSGATQSCGCYNQECRVSRIKHGKTKSKLYAVWNSIKGRCRNENNTAYKNYGGRGIQICDEWADDFETFYNWAINNGYSEELTVDRIDVDGNYTPDNCRFVSDVVQANNKRDNKIIKYNGISKTVSEWSKECGLKKATLYARLYRGWSFERAITTNINGGINNVTVSDINQFLSRFAGSSESVFTNGCCYWFAYILFGRFIREGATIMYDEVANHFGTRIRGRVYDITGDVTDSYKWETWESMTDELHRQRIIRDCINF